MSSGKFIPAIMQKNSTQLQCIKQQQLKSTCRFFQNKTKSQIPDMFVKKEDTKQPILKENILEALTGRLEQIKNKK